MGYTLLSSIIHGVHVGFYKSTMRIWGHKEPWNIFSTISLKLTHLIYSYWHIHWVILKMFHNIMKRNTNLRQFHGKFEKIQMPKFPLTIITFLFIWTHFPCCTLNDSLTEDTIIHFFNVFDYLNRLFCWIIKSFIFPFLNFHSLAFFRLSLSHWLNLSQPCHLALMKYVMILKYCKERGNFEI